VAKRLDNVAVPECKRILFEALRDPRLTPEWVLKQLKRFELTSERGCRAIVQVIELRQLAASQFPKAEFQTRAQTLIPLVDHFLAIGAFLLLPIAWWLGSASAISET
jgi:hypothetical protein